MSRKLALLPALLLLILSLITAVPGVRGQKIRVLHREDLHGVERKKRESTPDKDRGREVDNPAEAESLNREVWEFARHTPYDQILPYVAEEQRKSQASPSAEVELPNGWRIAPAGQQVEVGRLPYEAVAFAGKLVVLDTGYYYKEPQEVSIVDTQSGRVEKTLKIKSLFPSAIVGADGDLYISGGFDQKVFRVDHHFNVVREYHVRGFAAGLASIDAQHLAVSYMAVKNLKGAYLNGELAILNTADGKIEREIDLGYFPYAVRYIAGKLFVTLLGENKLLIYSHQLKLIKTISVGLTPQEMCNDDQWLYVVNTDSDSLSVIDTRTNRLLSTISLAEKGSQFGISPSSCAVDSTRLYVTLADTNSVAVLDRLNRKQLGLIPTGWYPTKVLLDKDKLLVVSAKGIRPRHPNPNGPRGASASRVEEYVLNLLKGSVSIIAKSELERNAKSWTDQGNSGSPIFDARQEISVLGHAFTTSGYASPFVEWLGNLSYSARWKGYPFGTVPATMSPVYLWDLLDEKKVDYRIYGENYFLFSRAYRILVERSGANSDLARKFYDKSILAAAGDDRGTEFNELARAYYGQANTRQDAYKLLGNQDFLKSLSRFLTGDQSFAEAIVHDDVLRQRFADYLYHYPFNFRSWDLKYSDLDRVREWKEDFETQIRLGNVAQLNYIWLPNDHTDGANTKILNAFEFVAQNDAALGRIVEIISHSPVWRDSLILVVEDDAQDGPDHVDTTRTIALAAGPYVKRGVLVSDRHDQLSMLRTIELLLGLRSLNSAEQLAAPMFGIFTDTPDFRPFVSTEPSKHLADADRERYRKLRR